MYALRGQGCGLGVLSDSDDPQSWPYQAAFGLEEGIYFILTGPAGDSISDAKAIMQAVGLNSYSAKLMFGDWLWWLDQANSLTRLVSPQGFAAGRLANLSPEQSSLNKPLYGIVGSETSGLPQSGQTSGYSSAAHDSPHFHTVPKVSAKTVCSASICTNRSINGIRRNSGIVGIRS